MTINTVFSALTASIPVVVFLSVVVALIIFVRYKGTIDALKDAATTYETLADARKQESEQLREEIVKLNKRIEELERALETQRKAIDIATMQIYAAIKAQVQDE